MEYRIATIPPYKSSFAKRVSGAQSQNIATNMSKQTKTHSSWPHLPLSQSSQPALPNPIREYSLPSVAHQTMVNRWIQSAKNAKRRNDETLNKSQPIECNATNNSEKKKKVQEHFTQTNEKLSSANCTFMPPTQPRTFIDNTHISNNAKYKDVNKNIATGNAPVTSNEKVNTMTLQRIENSQTDNAEVVSLLKEMLKQFTTFAMIFTVRETEHKDNIISTEEAKENIEQQEHYKEVHQETKATLDALTSVLSSMLTLQQSQADMMRSVQQELEAIHHSIKMCTSVMQKEKEPVKKAKISLIRSLEEHLSPSPGAKSNKHLHQTTQTDNNMLTSTLSQQEHMSHTPTREKQLKKSERKKRKTCHIILNQTQYATQPSVNELSQQQEQILSEHTQVISQLPVNTVRHSPLRKSNSSKVHHHNISGSSNKSLRLHKARSSQIKRHTSRSSLLNNVPLVLGCEYTNLKHYTQNMNNFVDDDDEESIFM